MILDFNLREGKDMSDLKEQNYGFGAGLTALFDYNPGIMPSFIEDVTESEFNGKKTKITNGKFFKVKTPKGNEFVIYIKYSDKLVQNSNMRSGFMWEFPLTEIEKNKIEAQYQNTGTFLILLVCINKTNVSLKDQIALLTWENYCEIRHRSNIQLGIWNNPNVKKQGAKVYYLRKGKGQKEEYFLKIKRNLLEKTKLDDMCRIQKEDEIVKNKKMHFVNDDESLVDSYYVESKPETLDKNLDGNIRASECLFIKDNVSWCGKCRCKTSSHKFEYISRNSLGNEKSEAVYVHKCAQCGQMYITPKDYEDIIKDKSNYKADIKIQRIRTLVDKVYLTSNHGCSYCDGELAISSCRLKIYRDIEITNKIEKIVEAELFYCKNCGIYYAEPMWHDTLLKKYGKNKINFVNEENKQQRMLLN